jgi:hypothetical protein
MHNGNDDKFSYGVGQVGSSGAGPGGRLRLPAVGTLKRYYKALEYEYRVKTAALGTLKRYSILFSHSIFRVVQCLLYIL